MFQDIELSGRKQNSNMVIAIGASAGGTVAIEEILEEMPADCPGIVIVQHMPEMFTDGFAQRLNQLCPIEVKQASRGDIVKPGRALIAPGNLHMRLRASEQGYVVDISNGPLVRGHRPSVDQLFASVAQAAGAHAVAVLLSGMGDDGASGMLEIKRAGGVTIAQDEHSCRVFGMPRQAIVTGAIDEVLPLYLIRTAVLQHCSMRKHNFAAPRSLFGPQTAMHLNLNLNLNSASFSGVPE